MAKQKKKVQSKLKSKCRRGYKFCKNSQCRSEIFIHFYFCPKCGHDLRPAQKNPATLFALKKPPEKTLKKLKRLILQQSLHPKRQQANSLLIEKSSTEHALKSKTKSSITSFSLKKGILCLLAVSQNTVLVAIQNEAFPDRQKEEFQGTLKLKQMQHYHRSGLQYHGKSTLMLVQLPGGQLLQTISLPYLPSKAILTPSSIVILTYSQGLLHIPITTPLQLQAPTCQLKLKATALDIAWDGQQMVGTLEGDILLCKDEIVIKVFFRVVRGIVVFVRGGVIGVVGGAGQIVLVNQQGVVGRVQVTNKKIFDACWDDHNRFLIVATDDCKELGQLVSFVTLDPKTNQLSNQVVLRTIHSPQQGFSMSLSQTANFYCAFSSEGEVCWIDKNKVDQLLIPKSKLTINSDRKKAGADRITCSCVVGQWLVWGDIGGQLMIAKENIFR